MKRDFRTGSLAISSIVALSITGCAVDAEEDQTSQEGIHIGLSAGLDLLDPQRSANGPDLDVMSQIYETLLSIDPETGELEPHLAESYELVDDTTWRFHLREDVEFSNGEPFNAEAVKFSVERILDPETASSSASQLSSVEEVTAVDEFTVDIITDEPDAVLPRRMQPVGGSGRVFIVPPQHFSEHSEEAISDNPVGTGPYELESWDKGQSATLVRNDEYWGEAPDIPRATFSFLTENSTRVNALLSGEVDLIQRVPIDDIDRLEEADGVHIESSEDGLVHTLLLDMRRPPFDELEVRQAFAHAIDVGQFVDQLLDGHGRELAVPMSRSVAQFDDSFEPYEYDPDRATQLLAEAGYEDGLTLETNTSEGRYVADREIYDFLNGQLTSAGFDIEPTTVEWGRLISMMASGDGGPFYIIGWDHGEGDASKMDSFLQSEATYTVADLPEYDRLSAEASASVDEAENLQLWQEAQQEIYENYAVGGMWQADSIYGLSDGISWTPEFGDVLTLHEIEITE